MRPVNIKAADGKVYPWHPIPRSIGWLHNRIIERFHSLTVEIVEDLKRGVKEKRVTEEKAAADYGRRLLESMSADDAARLEAYGNDLIAAGLRCPVEEVAALPESSWWFLFNHGVYGDSKAVVQMEEGDTSVETLEKFPEKLGVRQAGEKVSHLRPKSIKRTRHPRSAPAG